MLTLEGRADCCGPFNGERMSNLGQLFAVTQYALEFQDGQIVNLTHLREGQEATMLQLPAQPATAAEADSQKRVALVG